jgi:hypothetical protein
LGRKNDLTTTIRYQLRRKNRQETQRKGGGRMSDKHTVENVCRYSKSKSYYDKNGHVRVVVAELETLYSFLDHHFSKEPTGFDNWRLEFEQWKAEGQEED